MVRMSTAHCLELITSGTASATILLLDRRSRSLSYLQEGPPFGGPSCVLDPDGRIRTGIFRLDRPSLYQLSYLGVVLQI